MQFTLTSAILLLAGMVSASSSASPSSSAAFTPITSVPSFSSIRLPPTSVVQRVISAIPSASRSSIIAAESSAAAEMLSTKYYDCVHEDYGCNWDYSDYAGSGVQCGASPYEPGQQLADGHMVLVVSQNGTDGDCVAKAGSKCCKILSDNPCSSGYKFLDCVKA